MLHIISNLTGQLASLTGDLVALKNENSNLQATVHAMQRNNSKQDSLIQLLHRNISNFQSVVRTVQHNIGKLQTDASSGSTYVRWGKKSCSGNGTETVYSGFAAGGLYSHTGAATNYLCLVPDPVWGHYSDTQESYGKVYGAEYEFTDSKGQAYFGESKLHNEDAPCSVCRSPRPSVIMLPGRNTCYKGWALEYSGYLASGDHRDHAGTEYMCLDSHTGEIIGGQNNDDGAVLYFVEGICGSLKCPPYVNGRELTCAVCSK